jgi:hypothetical protein
MTAEDLRTVAEGIQAILISIGVVVGGIWALVRLKLTREIDKAKLEVTQLQRQSLLKKGLQRSIEVALFPGDQSRIPAIISVHVKNLGAEPYTLDFNNGPMVISRVRPDEDGNHEFMQPKRLDVRRASLVGLRHSTEYGNLILPGSSHVFQFYYEFPEEGIYCVEFVYPTPKSLAEHALATEEDGKAREIQAEIEKAKSYRGLITRITRFFVVNNPMPTLQAGETQGGRNEASIQPGRPGH